MHGVVRLPSRSSAAAAAVKRGVCSLLFLWRLYIAVAVVRFCIVKWLWGQAEIEAVNNNGGLTAIHFAAWKGKDAVATQLVNANVNVNAVDNSGNTPLHDAAVNGHAIVADLLLCAGANPKASNKSGKTPAQYAEQEGHRELAERLRQAEASAASK